MSVEGGVRAGGHLVLFKIIINSNTHKKYHFVDMN